MKKRRKVLKLSQRQLALAASCSQSYLSQVECGRRPLSAALAEKLEVILRVHKFRYRWATVKRGRPPTSPEALATLRNLRKAQGPQMRSLLIGKPDHPKSEWVRKLEDPLDALVGKLEPEEDLRNLNKKRRGNDRFWRRFNGVRYDSWTEKRLALRFALRGELVSVSPQSLQVELPCTDGRTGRYNGHRAQPAYIFQYGDVSIAAFPQRSVATPRCHRWPDHLIVASRGSEKRTAVVETDGADFHQDDKKRVTRDGDLNVPVIHIGAEEVTSPTIVDTILAQIAALFP